METERLPASSFFPHIDASLAWYYRGKGCGIYGIVANIGLWGQYDIREADIHPLISK